MKALLNVTATVLVIGGVVVAVLSFVEPGQVLFGIDMRLAGTLLVGGVVLFGLASVVSLLERISGELRQLRELGAEPPWLRHSAAPAASPAMSPAMSPARAAAPATGEAQWQPQAGFEAPPPAPEPDSRPGPEPMLQPASEMKPERHPEPETEPEPELPEHRAGTAHDAMAEPGEPEVPVPGPGEPEVPVPGPGEPELPEPGPIEPEVPEPGPIEPEEPEPGPTEPEPTEPEPREPRRAELRPSDGPSEDSAAPSQETIGSEFAELYVVEERMFRGRQARVLSDGTVEAETDEGWMRFEDFDHLEEYLDAMAASNQP